MAKARGLPRTPASDESSSSSPERVLYPGDDLDDFALANGEDCNTSVSEPIPNFRNMAVSMSPTTISSRARKSLSWGDAKGFGGEKTEPEKIIPVNRLPNELLILIFSKLSHPTDLRNCMLVSKNWASCSVELLWHRPYAAKWSQFTNVVRTLMEKSPTFDYARLIRRLNLTFLAKDISDGTLESLSMCRRLERLTLTSCKELTDFGLKYLIPNNPGLLALDLSNLSQLTDDTINTIGMRCLRLQGLNIAGCNKVTNASLLNLSQRCKLLKRVRFSV